VPIKFYIMEILSGDKYLRFLMFKIIFLYLKHQLKLPFFTKSTKKQTTLDFKSREKVKSL